MPFLSIFAGKDALLACQKIAAADSPLPPQPVVAQAQTLVSQDITGDGKPIATDADFDLVKKYYFSEGQKAEFWKHHCKAPLQRHLQLMDAAASGLSIAPASPGGRPSSAKKRGALAKKANACLALQENFSETDDPQAVQKIERQYKSKKCAKILGKYKSEFFPVYERYGLVGGSEEAKGDSFSFGTVAAFEGCRALRRAWADFFYFSFFGFFSGTND